MNVGEQMTVSGTGRLATARYDLEVAGRGGSGRWYRTNRPFRLATILQVPVGYQDATGFHCGVPQVEEAPGTLEPGSESADTCKI